MTKDQWRMLVGMAGDDFGPTDLEDKHREAIDAALSEIERLREVRDVTERRLARATDALREIDGVRPIGYASYYAAIPAMHRIATAALAEIEKS